MSPTAPAAALRYKNQQAQFDSFDTNKIRDRLRVAARYVGAFSPCMSSDWHWSVYLYILVHAAQEKLFIMSDIKALPEVLTAEEVAIYLRVSKTTICRWCKDGKLKAFRIGRGWRVQRIDLESHIRQSVAVTNLLLQSGAPSDHGM